MNAATLRFWRRINAKAATLTPPMATAYFAGIEALRARLTGRELEALIARGAVEQYVSLALSDANVSAAFSRMRAQIQLTAREAVAYFGKDIPGVARAGIGVAFDVLSPRVVTAIRALDTRVMTRLATATRETVRAIIENGLRDGAGPRQTAIAIRDMIGLGKSQLVEAKNFRAALEAGNLGKVQSYAARNRTVDSLLARGNLTPERIERAYQQYLTRRIAINAEATARTTTLESFKAGQRLSWQDAIDKGIVDGDRLKRQWITVMDGRERPEHGAMNGEVTGFDEPYSNGDMVIGEGSPWNCRCQDRVYVGRSESEAQVQTANDRPSDGLQSEVLQYAARLAPTEAIGASAELAEAGWATATDVEELGRRATMTREAVADVTKALGYRGEIEVVEQATGALRSRLGDQFTVMGQYSPGTKSIRLFAENIPSAAEARGVLVHEITHAQFDARVVSGKRDIFDWMKRNIPALEREDGVSPYSTAFWRRASSGDFMAQRDAINETLAEWSRLRAAGQSPTGRPTYGALYDKLFPKKGKK